MKRGHMRHRERASTRGVSFDHLVGAASSGYSEAVAQSQKVSPARSNVITASRPSGAAAVWPVDTADGVPPARSKVGKGEQFAAMPDRIDAQVRQVSSQQSGNTTARPALSAKRLVVPSPESAEPCYAHALLPDGYLSLNLIYRELSESENAQRHFSTPTSVLTASLQRGQLWVTQRHVSSLSLGQHSSGQQTPG
jgi:hypothetical protein